MNARPEPALYRHSARFFALFLALTVWAFWPSYFARLFAQPNLWFHAHGVVLTLWLAMLVVQAQLIRTQRRALHRTLGKVSFVLAPAVVVVTTVFIHQRMSAGLAGVPVLPPIALHFFALTLLSLVAFAIFYGLAIAARRDSPTHARWMVCTVFPLFTPVTDRLIGAHLAPLARYMPQIDGAPILPAAGFAAADLILVGLAWWDWRTHGRRDVFLVALCVLLLYHVGTLALHRVPLWGAFCAWFLGLPLS
jgi:hypothetical protein